MREIPIRELQLMKLDLLKIVESICEKENIKYFLAYGTLIGAVREKGFIPWDQDIDLWMCREEYERFNLVASKYLDNNKYFLQNYSTERELIAPITRICIKGTRRVAKTMEHLDYEKGSFIDIFPLDFSTEENYQEQYLKCRSQFRKILFMKTKSMSKSSLKRIARKVIATVMGIIPITWRKRSLMSNMTKFNSGNKLINLAGEYGFTRESFNPDWFSDVVYLDFEDDKFPCPVAYHEVLTSIYGDYMKRPDENNIKPEVPSYFE